MGKGGATACACPPLSVPASAPAAQPTDRRPPSSATTHSHSCHRQAALHAAKADKAAVARAAKKADAVLRQLVELTLRTDLTRIQRTNLETCITVHMHQKEVRAG